MADNQLRIKLSIGGFEIELEGDSQTVIQQFDDIKKNGLGRLTGAPTIEPEALPDIPDTPETPYESLNNVVLKQFPHSETEWVLLYAFYASEGGKKKFTREHILTKYEESKRSTASNRSNLSNNIKSLIRHNLISAFTSSLFLMTASGIEMTKRILSRKAR